MQRMKTAGRILFLGWILAMQAFAQAPVAVPPSEPAALTELRTKFQAAADAETALLNDLYQRALSGVQANAALDGDYEQALTAKRRRQQLVAQTQAIRMGANGTLGTELALKDARLTGGLLLSANAISSWDSPLASAEWILNRVTQGRYEVQVSYRWPLAAGTQVVTPPQWVLREVSSLPGAAANVTRVTLAPTTLPQAGQVKGDSVLTITTAPFALRLSLAQGDDDLDFSLLSVRLVPVSEAISTPSDLVGADLSSEFAALLQAHKLELRAQREPVVEEYISKLTALGKENGTGRKVLDAEIRRARGTLEVNKAMPDTLASASGKAGLTSLVDARYVNDPQNTGSRFKVEHEGQTFWVSLMWVAAAPPTPAMDVKAYRLARERFNMDELQAAALGQAAKEFTALYLSDRPLKLLAREEPGADGSLAALVFVEPVGLFQHVLVDHGLAVVEPGHGGKLAALEAGILASLQQRESLARSASVPEGGWAK